MSCVEATQTHSAFQAAWAPVSSAPPGAAPAGIDTLARCGTGGSQNVYVFIKPGNHTYASPNVKLRN